jgi:DNA-binding transcriptional ArsR family regulator
VTVPADDTVGRVLTALADPTRRAVFERVATAGPLTATALAADLPVSRQAISKHLDHLAAAGLVQPDRIGRETRWTATPRPLETTTSWFEDIGAAWDRRLGALARRIDEGRTS